MAEVSVNNGVNVEALLAARAALTEAPGLSLRRHWRIITPGLLSGSYRCMLLAPKSDRPIWENESFMHRGETHG